MKRHVLASVVALIGAATLTAVAAAAVAPGTYRGSLHLASGAKIPGSPAMVTVVGKKVTIKAPKFAIKCQGPSGKYDMPSAPIKYEFKGTLKGNAVSGSYVPPLGGTGEHFTAKGTFWPAKKSFTGTLSFVGRCKGTSTIRAKKA
ncbi:MAG: hypothetical protein ACRDMK_07040 [Gaiellaceae bacterium]